MRRLCRICDDFHDLGEPWPQTCVAHFAPRGRAAPSIRPDGIDPLRSMADGRVYDSKSAYYASVKRAGCEIVGDERAPFDRRPEYQPAISGHDIKRAIEELKSR